MSYSANKFFKFCPHCGQTYHGQRRPGVLACAKCRFQFYQNSKPTVSAFFEDKRGRIMLVKRAINPKKGWWDAPGGFLNEGEEPGRGLRREIREELGVTISRVRFLGIYMDVYRHGFDTHTLNIIYLAKIVAGRIRPMDDVGGFCWFSSRQIPWQELAFRWMRPALEDWIKRRK